MNEQSDAVFATQLADQFRGLVNRKYLREVILGQNYVSKAVRDAAIAANDPDELSTLAGVREHVAEPVAEAPEETSVSFQLAFLKILFCPRMISRATGRGFCTGPLSLPNHAAVANPVVRFARLLPVADGRE